MKTSKPSRAPLIASFVVILILLGGFAYYYVETNGDITSLHSSLSSEQNVVSNQASSIGALQANLTMAQSSISSLNSNVSAYASLVASLKSTIAANQNNIASLTSQLAVANALVSNLTSVVNLMVTKVLVNGSSITIYGNASNPLPFVTFSPTHAGYVLVAVTGATEGYLTEATYQPSHSNPSNATYQSVTGLTSTSPGVTYYVIPVIPGTSVTLSLVNNTSADGTATVTATYFY